MSGNSLSLEAASNAFRESIPVDRFITMMGKLHHLLRAPFRGEIPAIIVALIYRSWSLS